MHKEAAIRMSLMSADPQVQVRTRRQNLTKDDECRFTSTIRKVPRRGAIHFFQTVAALLAVEFYLAAHPWNPLTATLADLRQTSQQVTAQAQKRPQPHVVTVNERTVLAAERVVLLGVTDRAGSGNRACAALEEVAEVTLAKFRGVGAGETVVSSK